MVYSIAMKHSIIALKSLILGVISTAAMAESIELTVINQTPTSFVAKTRFGQVLGRIPQQTPTTIDVPLVALGKYAVSFIGDNGYNATLINKGDGPYCPTSLLSYTCDISQQSGQTQVRLKPISVEPTV